jgi:hypothetical protein
MKTSLPTDYNARNVQSVNDKILKLIKNRLEIGERKYGNQNIISNGRNFIQESLEEALDCSVYLAGKLIEISEKEKERQ